MFSSKMIGTNNEGGGEPALDGQRQIYSYNSNVYISNDYGANFTEIAALNGQAYTSFYISGNGLHIIVWKQYGQQISNDGGNSWSNTGSVAGYNSGYSISDDGQYVARTGNGQAYYSTDGGSTFNASSGENGGAYIRSTPDGQTVMQITNNASNIQVSTNYGASFSMGTGIGGNRSSPNFSKYLNHLMYGNGSGTSYYEYVNSSYFGQYGSGANAYVDCEVNGGKPDASVRYYMWKGNSTNGFFVSGLNSSTTTTITAYGKPNAMALNGSGQYRTITTPSGTYTSSDYGVTWVSNGDGISAGQIVMNQGDF